MEKSLRRQGNQAGELIVTGSTGMITYTRAADSTVSAKTITSSIV